MCLTFLHFKFHLTKIFGSRSVVWVPEVTDLLDCLLGYGVDGCRYEELMENKQENRVKGGRYRGRGGGVNND